jgi:hypothetical protein
MMIPSLPGFWAVFEGKDENTELSFPVVAWGNEDDPDDYPCAYIVDSSGGHLYPVSGESNFKRIDFKIGTIELENTCKETIIRKDKKPRA